MASGFVRISIDGADLDTFSESSILGAIEVRQELNDHWWCDIEIRQTEDKRFPFESALGKDLKLHATDEYGVEQLVFAGIVWESELDYEAFGSYTVRLVGVTKSYRLEMAKRRRFYPSTPASGVFTKLTGDAGISMKGAPPDKGAHTMVQVDESDFDFLKRLANDTDCWIRPTPEGLEAMTAFQPGPTIQWRAEDGLIQFRTRGILSPAKFSGAHYEYMAMESTLMKDQAAIPAESGSCPKLVNALKSESAKLPSAYYSNRSRIKTPDQWNDKLKRESKRSARNTISCWGTSRCESLKPGDEVTIEGVLDAAGTYGVTKVKHTWGPSGYINEFTCAPWKEFTDRHDPEIPSWKGILPARVVDNNDELNIGCVRIQYFWQEDNETSWVRMMTPNAGEDRGIMFLPEVGDEVWVYFEDGDPERARILGSAWNGVDKAPREEFWGDDLKNNDVKRIVTKAGHRITMVDKEGKEAMCIATPKHVKMMMTESSNETGDSVLTLHSDGDIVITAGGRIHMKSAYYSREVGS